MPDRYGNPTWEELKKEDDAKTKDMSPEEIKEYRENELERLNNKKILGGGTWGEKVREADNKQAEDNREHRWVPKLR